MKLVHWPLVFGLLHLVQREGVSVPITVLTYNGPLLCGFNVPIKGFTLELPVKIYCLRGLGLSE